MSPEDWRLIQDLYAEGLDLDGDARAALLGARYAHRPDLQAEVRSLWQHYGGDDFDSVRRLARRLIDQPDAAECAPIGLDRYRILEPLGQGGTGVVYRAQQQAPVKRLVALKVLSLGNCTPERLQRFRDEQQALALIDHANVARVYDCGETREGQPFYTMELLGETPITAWCDARQLKIEERLALFPGVCEGLARAHAKGIIHRDIKPANILVSESPDGPVARLIDFGIAKLESGRDATVAGAIMGTPGYMSPEQAAGGGEAEVDVRGDIYNLGAVLYELVTGVTPLGEAAESADSLEALFRITREYRPEPPGYRLDVKAADTAEIARKRGVTPARLIKALRGEPAWIIMKALAFHPEDRYATCEALIRDLVRYRDGLPLEAAPPQRFYRLRKLAFYYRRPLLLGAGFLAVLLAAILFITAALVRTRRAEAEVRDTLARLEAVLGFTQGIFEEVDPARGGRKITGFEQLEKAERDLAGRYAGRPELEASTRLVLGNAWRGLGLHRRARDQFRRALDLYHAIHGHGAEPSLRAGEALAFAAASLGDLKQARDRYQTCSDGYRRLFGPDDTATLRSTGGLAHVLGQLGRTDAAIPLFQQTLGAQERYLGPKHPLTRATRHNLANLLILNGDLKRAEPLIQNMLTDPNEASDPDHPMVLRALQAQALFLQKSGDSAAAAALYRDVWDRRERVLGRFHPDTLLTRNNLAVTLGDSGAVDEALTLLLDILQDPDLPRTEHPTHLRLRHNLGHFLMTAGQTDEAAHILQCVLEARTHILGPNQADTLRTRWTYAESLAAQGQKQEAQVIFQSVIHKAETHLGPNHGDTKLYKRVLPKPPGA